MRPNYNNEEEKTAFERLVGANGDLKSTVESLARNYGSPKGLLMEAVQGGIDAHVESDHTETQTGVCVDKGQGLSPENFEAEFLPTDTTESGE